MADHRRRRIKQKVKLKIVDQEAKAQVHKKHLETARKQNLGMLKKRLRN
jgi:hypothetical protein